MKKTLKVLLVVALLLVVLIGLTGCGNKLVATKEVTEDGVTYKEKTEIKFKDDKMETIKMTRTYKDKDAAEKEKEELDSSLSYMKLLGIDTDGIETTIKGKKLTMKFNTEVFSKIMGVEASETSVSKDELKKSLEESGYKVK